MEELPGRRTNFTLLSRDEYVPGDKCMIFILLKAGIAVEVAGPDCHWEIDIM